MKIEIEINGCVGIVSFENPQDRNDIYRIIESSIEDSDEILYVEETKLRLKTMYPGNMIGVAIDQLIEIRED